MAKKLIPSYEAAMNELKEISAALQAEALSVDDMSAKAKRAAELIQYCKEKLRNVEEETKDLFE